MKLFKPEQELIYYSQRNNFWNPSGACFPTCTAMAMRNNYLAEKYHWMCADDVIAMFCNTGSVGRTYAQSIGIKGRNINIYWQVEEYVAKYLLYNLFAKDKVKWEEMDRYVKFTSYTIDEIKAEIDKGYGVIVSIYMRRRGTNIKRGGHIIYCVGYDNDGLIFLDPYGNWNSWYKDTNGKLVTYSYDKCESFLKDGDKKRVLLIHSDLKQVI